MQMKKKLDLSTVMSLLHLTVILSLACFGTALLTLSILAIPSVTAAFVIGKDVIYRKFDVNDGLLRRFFSELSAQMCMMKYFPLQLLIILQTAGIVGAQRTGMTFLSYPMLICISILTAVIIYIISYHIFFSPKPTVTEVLVAMLYRIHYFLIVWIVMLLVTVLFGVQLMGILLIFGEALLLAVEISSFLGVMGFKKLKNMLTDEEKEFFGEDILKKL